MEGESERMQYGNAEECRDRKMEIERGCMWKKNREIDRKRETNGESKSSRKHTVRGRKRERERKEGQKSRD